MFGAGAQWGYYSESAAGGYLLLTNRYYDPATGRFITRDPIGYAGGINLYGYVGNNAGNGVDPLGLDDTNDPGRNYGPDESNIQQPYQNAESGRFQSDTSPGAPSGATVSEAGTGTAASILTVSTSVPEPAATSEAPATAYVNLASEERTRHILDGDPTGTGGGHGMGRGRPGKSEFPIPDAEALHHISDIATDPCLNWEPVAKVKGQQRFRVDGTRAGLDIRVIIEPGGKGIISGYPTNVPRNP